MKRTQKHESVSARGVQKSEKARGKTRDFSSSCLLSLLMRDFCTLMPRTLSPSLVNTSLFYFH